jgi:ankyrin repeat protein
MEHIHLLQKNSNKDPSSKFFSAAWSDDAEAIKKLLNQGCSQNMLNSAGWTPLHLAAAQRSIQSILLLTDDHNAVWVAEDGVTPLHLAAKYGHTRSVILLSKAGTKRKKTQRMLGTQRHLMLEPLPNVVPQVSVRMGWPF